MEEYEYDEVDDDYGDDDEEGDESLNDGDDADSILQSPDHTLQRKKTMATPANYQDRCG